jgi:hypothetical protein
MFTDSLLTKPLPIALALALGACDADSISCEADTGALASAASTCPAGDGLSWLPPVAPNVMLVIDRSGSMEPHWRSLQALTPYIEGMGSVTNAGLALFPSNGGCGVDDTVAVWPAEDRGDDILDAVSRAWPGGSTPIAAALDAVRGSCTLQDPGRENVLIFVGDGAETCDGDPVAAVEAWADMPVPVKMHFISFAADSAARSQIGGMADAAEDGAYYDASDVASLVERLDRVVASLSPCGYALIDEVDAVQVSLDGEPLSACASEDCSEGYAYDPSTGVVTLAPLTCRAAAAADCPDIVIEAQ